MHRNLQKTHCPAGHPYDEQNTHYTPKGHRICRACHNRNVKSSYAQNPEPVRARRRKEREQNGDEIRRRSRERYAGRIDEVREADRARYARSPQKRIGIYRNRHGGMPPEEWAAMWEAQQGRCYLGGEPLDPSPVKRGPGKIAIDHDHSCCPPGRSCSLCRRGLACNNCNLAIGLAGEDPERLRRMADALEAAKSAAALRIAARPVQDSLTFEEAS